MSRHRSGAKKAPPEIGLHMECVEEDLELCQIVHYNKAETEYNEIQNKLDNYLNKMKAEVIEKGENCIVLQLNVTTASAVGTQSQVPAVSSSGKVTRQSVQAAQNYQQVVSQGILTRSSTNAAATATAASTYLVMDPRLGLVVGQVPQSTLTSDNATSTPPKLAPGTRSRVPPNTDMVTTRTRSGVKKPSVVSSESEILTTSTRSRDKIKSQPQVQQPASPPAQVIQQVYSSSPQTPSSGSYRIKVNAKPLPAPAKPAENNALGGLTAGSNTAWKPNSEDGGNKGNGADSKEVTFNKMSGKTFPSLVVTARPHLRLKFIPQSNITQERTILDAKVKGVLMYTPSTFTEWLIQEGLIKNEQVCQYHVNNDVSPVKLKLGMYSDVRKFPYSGGYVWISPCCPSQFVSVFYGSIFEGAPHPPTTLLKLIYHWACQTNVQNVVQWVKVDNSYVKNFFTNMRAVCTQAIHHKHQKLGGPRAKIEVGVISLGTTSQDGNMRQVKVEVLGVMDLENKLIRLRALEPISEEKNLKRRFVKILEPMEEWVHKESTIFTDFTVDKGTLLNMGFRNVYQISSSDPPTKYSNHNVMEYLRRIVPRMFQNTLSLLSRQIIQQFLDELVWREMWGPIPSQAFDNIIAHIAEQTKPDFPEGLLLRLNKVASNPFKNWNYSIRKSPNVSHVSAKTQPSTQTEATESGASVLKNRTRKRTADQIAGVDVPITSTPIKKLVKTTAKDKIKKEEKPKSVEKSSKKETPEKEKPITEDIISFINDKTTQISLDSYYYGIKEGEEEAIASEYKGTFNVRCSVCNRRCSDNISLMKHMILHSQLEPAIKVSFTNVQQCRWCFLGFNTNVELKDHMDEVHLPIQNKLGTDCYICEERFSNRVQLIYHMHRTHVEMELPYECGVCMFRTSIYKLFIDHFLEVHIGGEHIFCHFCLKIFTVAYKGKCLPVNVRFYENHLEKHSRMTLTAKCHRCKLSFIHKGIADQHLEADHCSYKSDTGIKPFTQGTNTVMMPEPGSLIKLVSPPKSLKIYRARPVFTCNKFKALDINGIEDDMACLECEGSLMKPDHFKGTVNCSKCRYATCCERAISEHITIFHESAIPQFSAGKPVLLPDGMFCLCGYSSYSGNKLAKHLAICEKRTAYPNEAAANAVSAVAKFENSLKPQETGEAQNMLNMLGLIRKSPEDGSSADTGKNENQTQEEELESEFSQNIESKAEKSELNEEEDENIRMKTDNDKSIQSTMGKDYVAESTVKDEKPKELSGLEVFEQKENEETLKSLENSEEGNKLLNDQQIEDFIDKNDSERVENKQGDVLTCSPNEVKEEIESENLENIAFDSEIANETKENIYESTETENKSSDGDKKDENIMNALICSETKASTEIEMDEEKLQNVEKVESIQSVSKVIENTINMEIEEENSFNEVLNIGSNMKMEVDNENLNDELVPKEAKEGTPESINVASKECEKQEILVTGDAESKE